MDNTKTYGLFASQTSLANLKNGTIMQIDWKDPTKQPPLGYSHTTICVDAANQLFAQHTQNAEWHYADYVVNHPERLFRFMDPSYILWN
jgi:hypothetical protein